MEQPGGKRSIIEPVNWAEFVTEFAQRNYNRRARFDVFRANGATQAEEIEAHLEDVHVNQRDGKTSIDVLRIDRSEKDASKVRDTIEDVIGVTVQYDTDGSEDILEITDRDNTLISLRLESKVDGVS